MRSRLQLETFLRGVKNRDVAHRAGVDPAFVSRVLAGKQRPSARIVRALAEELGLPLERVEEMIACA